MSEAERITRVYAQRQREGKETLYSLFNEAQLYTIQARERALLRLLKQEGLVSLADSKILDVGCGDGGELRRFVGYGANPDNLYGVDLLGERATSAKALNPNIHVLHGNAERLPLCDDSFDMVMQFTMFSSILDRSVRQKVAGEMKRVAKPGGLIVWYDLRASNPRNPNVRGIRQSEIEALFPGCLSRWRRVTLAPPLARALAPLSWLSCHLLERTLVLCTHYLYGFRIDGH
jgi:ubiquinone/menaquinone biosynthesis C-methylase UbiE